MEGVSDFVARGLLSGLGGMDFCVTEFVRVTDRPLRRRALLDMAPELDRGGRTVSGVPVVVQLLGARGDALAETASLARALGALGVDLNFGCPARRVNGHDGGAALLRDARRVEATVAAVRRALPAPYPVSAKIRLGWDDPDDVVALTRAAEAGGASFVTIHGRTKVQMYRPYADWRRIGRARAAVGVPVVANGDLFAPSDLERCRAESGCEHFMVGRGAFRCPNLFRWLRGLDRDPWPAERSARLLERFALATRAATERFRSPERAALARTKQWVRYLAERDPAFAACFDQLKRSSTLVEALQHLLRVFPPQGPTRPSGPGEARAS